MCRFLLVALFIDESAVGVGGGGGYVKFDIVVVTDTNHKDTLINGANF